MIDTESKRDAIGSAFFAYTAPFIAFMIFMAATPGIAGIIPKSDSGWLARPEFLIYPLQTIVCGALLLYVRRQIEFRGIASLSVTFAVGFFVFAIWTAPQFFHWAPPRVDDAGFNPDLLADSPAAYWFTVIFRFLRLVIVVPLLEEIFWRGFLMRWLIQEKFTSIPFGTFRWNAFLITVLGFGLEHWGKNLLPGPDFAAAILTGIIYNIVACLTRSLGSCVFTHAVTNLFLGLHIMLTKQWGYW